MKIKITKNAKYLRDYYTTKLFSSEDCLDYIMAVIASSLDLNLEEIKKDFKLIDIRLGVTNKIKRGEADVIAKNDNMYFNIEFNYGETASKETMSKNISYICSLILKQIKPGKKNKYSSILLINQINIDGYDLYGKNEFRYITNLVERKSGLIKYEQLVIVDVNLEYLKEIDYNEIKKMKKYSLERLLYIFVCNDIKILEEIYKGDKMMENVVKKLIDYDAIINEYMLYDKEELIRNESIEIGETRGFKKGHIFGLKEGHLSGLKEGKIQIAKKMIAKNKSDEEILEIIDISLDELNNLRADIPKNEVNI